MQAVRAVLAAVAGAAAHVQSHPYNSIGCRGGMQYPRHALGVGKEARASCERALGWLTLFRRQCAAGQACEDVRLRGHSV